MFFGASTEDAGYQIYTDLYKKNAMELGELIIKKAANLEYTFSEIINQLKLKGPLPLREKVNASDGIDWYGIVEHVCWRINDSLKCDSLVGALVMHGDCPDGLIYDRYGRYDHESLLSLLEETRLILIEKQFQSEDEVGQLCKTFYAKALSLRN